MKEKVTFDEATKKWFATHIREQPTLCQCPACKQYYKADLEHKCKRGTVNGKKYCRIPIASKIAEIMMEKGIYDLNAETILSMPKQEAALCIDAIISDWQHWLDRAGELFIRCRAMEAAQGGKDHEADLV